MTERELMMIKRDLQKRAKRMGLGKKRSGAYVFGTLRKIRGNPRKGKEDYREFLVETLIPDLKESGYEFTAEDFETIVWYLDNGKDKDYPRFKKYIVGQLVPDLKESGRTYAAKDFLRGIKFIDKGGYFTGGVFQASEPRGASRVVKKELFPKKLLKANPACMRSLQANGGKTKTWKLGEYASGGIIQAKVSGDGNAVAIRVLDYYTKEPLAMSMFRWPMDKFVAELYLNELTTSYYSNVILDWIASAAK